MHISSLFSVEELDKAVEEGYVSKRKHPIHPIWIYNYTAKTQFEWSFNKVTLNCRGLVLDESYNIVARSLPKFFSYEQLEGKLPEGNFVVEEKMDGSMLLVFNYKGEIVTATRGSFESDQAEKAKEFLNPETVRLPEDNSRYDSRYGYRFESDLTYVFEIIYKDNRVVVDYDFEGLTLLTIIDKTGMEYDSAFVPFNRPKVYTFSSLEEILSYEEPNLEGFVLKYFTGERVKIKLAEYKRLHRLLTGVSEKTVWEALKDNKLNELLENVPDEFFNWVKEVQTELESKFKEIKLEAMSNMKDLGDRKENALYYQTQKYPSLMFNLLDGKSIDESIWKLVKPKVTKVFKMVNEESN